jgi:DNA-directed RNA polymerase specialized sigma24 family protein
VEEPSPTNLRDLLVADPPAGWRLFIDRYTPALLGLIERAGIVDRDEAMEIYVLVCQRLSENQCQRLRRRDPDKGSMHGWLAVVVRHVTVDWVRSRAGRRRLFGAIKQLSAIDQRVFELYYWEDRRPTEIAGMIAPTGADADMATVFESLDRIERALTERHRAELLSLAARSRPMTSLDAADGETSIDVTDAAPGPEEVLAAGEDHRHLAAAIATLPAEDAAIVRLRFLQGLSLRDTARALHLDRVSLSDARVSAIVARLRSALEHAGMADRTFGAVGSTEGGTDAPVR